MQIKLNNNTFLRNINGYAYLINQRTKKEKIFDDSSFLFLSKIEREFKDSEFILLEILKNFENSDYEIITNDFFEFINELVSENFIELNQESVNIVSQNGIILNPVIEDKKQIDIKETSELLYEILLQKPFLFSLQIELLSHCNEQCIHCYIPKEKKSTLDFETVNNILEQAKSMGVLSISFTGGEPFLFKNFHSVLRKARENDFVITILSNLTLINQKDIEVLKELNIYNIQVSIYSMIPEIHDSITKLKGSFIKTIDSIEHLIKSGISIEVSCPIIKENMFCYNDVLDWCNSKGIKVYTDFNITAITDFSKSNLKHRLNKKELEQTLTSILLHDKKYNIFSIREMQSIQPDQPVKFSAFKSIAISSKGCYIPDVGWDEFVLGDVNKDTLENIWMNSEQLHLLRTLKYKTFTECLNCSASGYCTLCLSWNYYENGGNVFNIPKTFCEYIYIIKEMVEKYKAL